MEILHLKEHDYAKSPPCVYLREHDYAKDQPSSCLHENPGVFWDGKDVTPCENLHFKSKNEVREFMKAYSHDVKCKFVITKGGLKEGTSSKNVTFSCTYGRQRPSIATKKRPHVHTKKINCKAYVSFYARGENYYLVTFSSEHNHPNYEERFQYEQQRITTPEEISYLSEAVKLNCKPSIIKKRFSEMFDKDKISTMHIHNVINSKIKKNKGLVEIKDILQEIKEDGGNVDILYNSKKEIRALVIQTSTMLKAYEGISPQLCQLDTTFKFESSGYKMTCFVYLNPVSNRGEIVQVAFISDECAEVYNFVFTSLKTSLMTLAPNVIIVDKDFNEINELQKVFGNLTILLCTFHVIKWLRIVISTACWADGRVVDCDGKHEMMKAFKRILYSRNEEDFESEMQSFLDFIVKTQVRVGNNKDYVIFSYHFVRNWESCRIAHCYRRNITCLMGNHTNNCIERFRCTI